MPRADSAPYPTSILNDDSKGPLKRGDACLYCRKRRIKCNAEKPSCSHCTKLKRECIYDSSKPVSRVKQLEDKVAQLEGMLQGGVPSGSNDVPPPFQHRSSSSTSDVNGQQDDQRSASYNDIAAGDSIDVNMLQGFTASSSTSFFGNDGANDVFGGFPNFFGNMPGSTQPLPQLSQNSQSVEEMFDFSMLDPSFMNLVNSFSNASTGPSPTSNLQQPLQIPQPQQMPLQQMPLPPMPNPIGLNGPMELDYGATGLTPYLEQPSPQSSVSPTSSQPQPTSSTTSLFTQPQIVPQTNMNEFTPQSNRSSMSNNYKAYVSDPDLQPNITAEFEDEITKQYADEVNETIGVRGPPAPANPPLQSAAEFGWKDDIFGNDEPAGLPLVGGWFDAADLPKVARDHLLDLFFSGMRMFGQNIHVPRFLASLSLPASKRPHPCLLYSMYLMACRISSSSSIRSLEPHFYSIASKQLDESVVHADRLFDAVRAMSILAVYKYSQARYLEGWMMTGQAGRLAIACGLHSIPSNVFRPSALKRDRNADLAGVMRARTSCLPPPRDSIELGERIWSFWSIYTIDRCGSISAQWPPGIIDEIVTTPYPRPIPEYELDLLNVNDDDTISSIWDPTPQPPLPHYLDSTVHILRIRAIAILERASKLMYLRPEPGWDRDITTSANPSPGGISSPPYASGGIDEFLSFQNDAAERMDPNLKERGKGWTRTAKIRTPKAYGEVKRALERVEADLPPERRTDWGMWDGKVQYWHYEAPKKDVYTLHFVIGCAWMFLFDVFSYNTENPQALAVARRLVVAIRNIGRERMGGDLDVFIAMTWSFIVKILIREVKRLHTTGDKATAGPIEQDIGIVVQGLKIFGRSSDIASAQAVRVERYQKSTVEEMRFMEKREMDELAHVVE